MKVKVLIATFALAVGVALAAERPSFAGNWVLDRSQSSGAVPDWSGMQIGQTGHWFRVGQTDKNGRQVTTLEGECRMDGRFHPVQGGEGGSISCKWDGSTLVARQHWGANDENERTIRTMLLSDGTLVQDIAASGPAAGGSAHLVFKRQ